jgi:hypothetical protein
MNETCRGRIWKERNAYKILVGKRKRGHSLRIRHRWEDIVGMGLREIGLEKVDWIHRAQDRDRRRALVKFLLDRGTFLSKFSLFTLSNIKQAA